jgi:hypothetical protein
MSIPSSNPLWTAPLLQLNYSSESESESYVTTDGQSASLSWNKTPIWGLGPYFYYCQTAAGLLMLGALSDERMGLSFTITAGLASAVILGSESRGTRDQMLLSPSHDVHFRRRLRLAGLRWRYSTPPPHYSSFNSHPYNSTERTEWKRRFQQYLYCCMSICCIRNVFTEPLPRNGSGIFVYVAIVV